MPFRFDIKPEQDLLYVEVFETATGRQLLECMKTYVDEPAFHPEIDTLYDLTADTQIMPGKDAVVETLAETARAARNQERYRLACAARNSEHRTVFQTAGEVLSTEVQVRTFSCLSPALSWMGHDEADLHPLDLESCSPD